MDTDLPNHAERAAELIDRLGRMTRERCFESGLNPAQWQALRYVSRANQGSRTPSALAEFLGTTKGTASQTLIALENKGYLRKVRAKADRRKVRLELTDDGHELLATDPIFELRRAAAELPRDMGSQLVQGLSRLLTDLQRRNGGRPFGICRTCGLFRDGAESVTACGHICGLTGQKIEPGDEHRMCLNFRS